MSTPAQSDRGGSSPAEHEVFAATTGSARKPRSLPKWQVVEGTENMPGGCGPDFALIYLRGGRVLEVGDEGINVYRSFAHFVSGELSAQSLTFRTEPADSPSGGAQQQIRAEGTP